MQQTRIRPLVIHSHLPNINGKKTPPSAAIKTATDIFFGMNDYSNNYMRRQKKRRDHKTFLRTQNRTYAFFDCHSVRGEQKRGITEGTDQNFPLIDRRRFRVIKGVPHLSI